tara:strand:+ start:226 stop:507 length:282 start_codon:yes stop_codon:yes gene_type:complete
MKKAKIYKPSKSAMQSGTKKYNKWILEFITENNTTNPLMGWESSNDTYSEIKLEFELIDDAINYAKKNLIEFEVIEPKTRKVVIKSYSDNFTK